jgi:glycerol-3-phosphate O-acyltransferase
VEADAAPVKRYAEQGIFPPRTAHIIEDFYGCYLKAISPPQIEKGRHLLKQWLELVVKHIKTPYAFEIFHQAVRQPFDYYQFGLDLIRPLVDFSRSQVLGKEQLKKIDEQIQSNENVILLANHQTEPDPQIISLLLEKEYPKLASEMIFVAGYRVISDPLAIPMSLGRNLLCIYSKKHMDHPPEEKSAKILHNQRTMKKMVELLNQGGNCIYVAPSGGRDRTNARGIVEVADFDPDSLELFWLLAKQASRLTHFYPLALKTYDLMPPPKRVEKELGEKRLAAFTPVYLAFGEEVQMDLFPGSEQLDKPTKRIARANYISHLVKEAVRNLESA